jgi:hypothetical protein
MAYILPILTVLIVLAPRSLLADDSLAASPPADGNALVQSAVQALVRLPPLEAKVRQRATIMGQWLAGAGLYVQAPGGEQPLVRFEFKMQVADHSVSVLQVNDGSTLWIRRDDPHVSTQSYVDLRQLRDATKSRSLGPQVASSNLNQSLAIGGLAQLLSKLSENFAFGQPKPGRLSEISVWEVTGHWKKSRLIDLLPGQQSQIESGQVDWGMLPEHLPTTVRLTLGRDRTYPLFPYLIEYSRFQAVPASGPVAGGLEAQPLLSPLVTMVFKELRQRTDLGVEYFRYVPSDENVEDKTGDYLRELEESAGRR